MSQESSPETDVVTSAQAGSFRRTEDFWAILLGAGLLLLCLVTAIVAQQNGSDGGALLKQWLAKPGSWDQNVLEAFEKKGQSLVPSILVAWGVLAVVFIGGAAALGKSLKAFVPAFGVLLVLATLAYVLAGQVTVKDYNLEYALWALLIGLLISNTVGTPEFLKSGACTEFFIKTGLVLLGAEVLIPLLMALGLPGVFVAWVVTPIVLISTFWFGQKVLRMPSPSLNMVISADMSVCGVSAAIATAAACKAKKEELSLAIGLSLSFTVVMMVVMPAVIRATGMSEVLGGAWMGGTIDATGAVAAAGAMLGDQALAVATTIKMIQNILIGFTAFGVAVYWVARVERSDNQPRVGVGEIWRRFPKFILGFAAASILFSLIFQSGAVGQEWVEASKAGSKTLRGWCFCLAFVSIGLETNFAQLFHQLHRGKPLVLYLVGQTLNLILTLAMAWLMFEVVFPGAADVLEK